MKNIVINDKIYELNLKPISDDDSYTGKAYRMQIGNDLLAVKIYRTEKLYDAEEDGEWFPSFEEIQKFNQLSSQVQPILLSNVTVYNEDGDYIGCGSYYVNETEGPISNLLFRLPISKFFNDIFKLEESISLLTKEKIVIDDWNTSNIKFGNITSNPADERIYAFDDSNYQICSDFSCKTVASFNRECFNDLAMDILEDYYCLVKPDYGECKTFRNILSKQSDKFRFLERDSRNYPNIGSYLEDRVKIKK